MVDSKSLTFKQLNLISSSSGIVDEAALLTGLEDGRVGGAALDVFLEVINELPYPTVTQIPSRSLPRIARWRRTHASSPRLISVSFVAPKYVKMGII